MIVVIGTFRLPVANLDAGREAMARVIHASRAEPGCIDYSYATDALEAGMFRVSEVWETRAALTAHFETAHMKAWQAERADLGMTDRRISAYEAGNRETL